MLDISTKYANIKNIKALSKGGTMITIHDVAQKAGVSIATVSYALNNKKYVSEKTKARINQIASEMGYVPNSFAKGLLKKKSNMIGLIISSTSSMNMPYTSSIIMHLEYYTRLNGYYILIGNSADDLDVEKEIIDNFVANNVDALIIMPTHNAKVDRETFATVQKRNLPFIFLNSFYPNIKGNYIVPDLEEGEYLAAQFLLENGHRDIIFIGGHRQNLSSIMRYQGFKKAVEDHGLVFQETQIIEGGFSFHDGYQSILNYMDSHDQLPQAILTTNDFVALGVYKGLKEHGVSVPEEVSLVGYDDINWPMGDSVPLTTVRIPVEEMCRLCIEHIINSINNNNLTIQSLIKPELIIRNSVRKL
jgi:LacI family transcriptional regulator